MHIPPLGGRKWIDDTVPELDVQYMRSGIMDALYYITCSIIVSHKVKKVKTFQALLYKPHQNLRFGLIIFTLQSPLA